MGNSNIKSGVTHIMEFIKNHWLTITGLAITGAYLCFAYDLRCSDNCELETLRTTPINILGDFLAGIFAPLAFLWLVIGYFQNNRAIHLQAEELRNSVEEMKEANKTSTGQLESIKNNEKLNKRDLFFRYAEIQTKELDSYIKSISSAVKPDHFKAYQGHPSVNGYIEGHRDIQLLTRNLVNFLETKFITSPTPNYSTLKKDSEADKAFKAYLRKFEELLQHANEYDPEQELSELYRQSTYNLLYGVIQDISSKHNGKGSTI